MNKWFLTLVIWCVAMVKLAASEVNNLDGVVKWKVDIGFSYGGTAIDHNGNIYAASANNGLFAISPEGRVKWILEMPTTIYAVPSIDSDNNIYIGSDNAPLYSINDRGNVNWTFASQLRLRAGPSIMENGDLVFNSGYDTIMRVSKQGELVWKVQEYSSYDNKIALDDDGNSYFCGGSPRKFLVSLSPEGNKRWEQHLGGSCDNNHVSLDAQQNAFLTIINYPYSVTSMSKMGVLRWQSPSPSLSKGTATIANDGSLYLVNYDQLSHFDVEGNHTAVLGLSQNLDSAVIRADGSMIITSDVIGTIRAISKEGKQLWSRKTGRIPREVSIGDDGTIYFTSEDGYLYALHGNSPLADSPWPNYGQNNQNTGRVQTELFNHGGELQGTYDTQAPINASPLVTENAVYIGNDAGVLTALDKSNNKRWDFATGASIKSAPLWLNGSLIIGNSSGEIYSVTEDGHQQWRTQLNGSVLASAIAIQNDILIATVAGEVSLLNGNGELQWTTILDGGVFSKPTVDEQGIIYLGTYNHQLYALNMEGDIQWQQTLSDRMTSSVALKSNGLIVTTLDGVVSLLDFAGNTLWQTTLNAKVAYSSPLISSEDAIYLGSFDKHLYKLSADGDIQWKVATDGWLKASPIELSQGNVVIGSSDNYLYSFYPNGELAWKYQTQGKLQAAAATDEQDRIFIGSNDGHLYVVSGN